MACDQEITDNVFLLTEDIVGRGPSVLRIFKTPVTINRGELVIPCKEPVTVTKEDHTCTHNYCVARNPSTTFYCMEQDVVAIDDHEFKLLKAIPLQKDRYRVYSEGRLKWGTQLKPNDEVIVKLPPKARPYTLQRFNGTVRVVGTLTQQPGFLIEVQLKEQDFSEVEFSFNKGYQFFFDRKQKCVLVSLDKLCKPNTTAAQEKSNDDTCTESSKYKTMSVENGVTDQDQDQPEENRLSPHLVENDQLNLDVQSRVQIPSSDPRVEYQYGVIRWIGTLHNSEELFAGIELDEKTIGCTDGTHKKSRKKYFKCPPGRGIYFPLGAVMLDERSHVNPKVQLTVNSSLDAPNLRDPPIALNDPGPGHQPWVEHDNIHRGIHQFPADQHPPQQMQRVSSTPQLQGASAVTVPPGDDLPTAIALDFEIGSTIQIQVADPTQPPKYGVIKWIGELPGILGQVAGIELDEYLEGCTDGTWQQTGQRYFECPQGKGIFYPVSNLKRDERFCYCTNTPVVAKKGNPLDYVPKWEPVDQHLEPHPQQMLKYIGEEKGIQGHQNSCYLDATVFGLFALSEVFDTMFLEAHEAHKTVDLNRESIEDMLWKGIVNPLRKNGVVRYESVMKLRSKLDELGNMEGIAQDENDPLKFLNMLFKHILHVEPFIEIRDPFGVEQEYFVQLIVEVDEDMRLPTVGDLLMRMFRDQNISFNKMPSHLLIQVPQFGEQSKTFQKIIPDLKLHIMNLIDTYQNAQVPNCFVCDQRAVFKCTECSSALNMISPVNFCGDCDKFFHTPKDRADHPPRQSLVEGVSELDLLSVICIETSHYVCFTKEPHEEPDQPSNWIFFDSMANTVYDDYNIPKVTDCSAEMNNWIYPANGDHTQLMSTPAKNLPEYVRRFTQDVYMCVYVHPDLSLYGTCNTKGPTNDEVKLHQQQPSQETAENQSLDQQLALKNAKLKNKNKTLLAQNARLCEEKEHRITTLQQENTRLQEQLTQQRTELQQQMVQERAIAAEEKEKMLNSQRELQQQMVQERAIAAEEKERMLNSQRELQQQMVQERAIAAEEKEKMLNSQRELQQQMVQERAIAAEEKERMLNSQRELQQQMVQERAIAAEEKEKMLNSQRELQQQMVQERAIAAEEKERILNSQREFQQEIVQERAVAAEEKERMINSLCQTEQQLRSQLQLMETQLQELQRQLDNSKTEVSHTQLQIPPQEEDSWNVPRDQVETFGEIGRGGWGLVLKGKFRGQQVAVKKAFKEILEQPYTIRLMKREIQIMASVQHPNLVRFIAAVIDDKVDRGEETPLLVVELLDMDLRHAYKTTDLGTNKIPIFRDVAYALHYLHEHQEPIIHRDVSAPNVLLEYLQGGMYRAKLSDFGSANKVKDARTAGTGAICYSAPETFPPGDLQAPMPPQTPKIDVYSYGILLAEVITEIMPTTENRGQLLREVQQTWTLMYDLIRSCTMPNPSDRPTMVNILNTLNRIPTARLDKCLNEEYDKLCM